MPDLTKSNLHDHLLPAILKKDQAAFNILFDTYSTVLFAIICKSHSDSKLCEEILQKSFLKIWQSLPGFNPVNQRLLAWMLSITRDVSQEMLEQQKLNKNSKIQTVVNNVFKNSDVLTLIYFKGYSLKKAAETLDISIEEIKLRLKNEFDQIRESKVK